MPIYEYQCTSCGHEMESIQKMSDEPLKDCPACGGATLIKKVSAPVFRLKGSGWYETDFKSGTKKQLADDDSGGEKKDHTTESASDKKNQTAEGSKAKSSTDDKTSSGVAAAKSESTSPSSAKSVDGSQKASG